ncbi:hypothetical protein PV10_08457 [Exophiala mesophila]|uniref:Transcription factor domain-containing protein n=1 Tax=Exophiala mesophila TaxID=212818 RepID=A0A0D1Z4G4_EXOME|nr:uncharacterized protein PV10_08457 [Exophiala mesophila]KIV88819.1 hypothetical protein PV10_08457 [Exophiala mesophila]
MRLAPVVEVEDDTADDSHAADVRSRHSVSFEVSRDNLLPGTKWLNQRHSSARSEGRIREEYVPSPSEETDGLDVDSEFPILQSRPGSVRQGRPHQNLTPVMRNSPYLSTPGPQSGDLDAGKAAVSNSPLDIEGVDLEVLDYLASNPLNLDLLTANSGHKLPTMSTFPHDIAQSVTASSPDLYMTYYPDAVYKDLHSQLHNHIVETARNVALTAQGTPEFVPRASPQRSSVLPLTWSKGIGSAHNSPGGLKLLVNAHITQKRAASLWRNYLEEIAPWLDMFDNSKHWQTTIAQMALRVDCLQFSLLALSARQQERKSLSRSHTESLNLYQEAIRLITVQLPTLYTEVIAAVILLCVLEMMSSSPRAWAKHLDGCAMLLEVAGINGVVGGVREVLFWTFARMDVYKAFISDTVTSLPTNRWFISTDSMSAAVRLFKGKPGSDSYANYAIFLCAGVVNILSNKESTPLQAEHSASGTFVSRWRALFELHEGWYNDRPDDMKPLINLLVEDEEETQSMFSTILFSTPAGISGNQVYHASMILLLQHKPKEIRLPRSPRTMLWHARQICGISLSNSDHGALVNALQPIWIAGKLMSYRREHKVILDLLKFIEEETGWATSWRAEDLKEFWGIYDEQA